MFTKHAFYALIDPVALNRPVLSNSVFIDQDLQIDQEEFKITLSNIRLAASKAADKMLDGENTDFDLEAEIKEHPDSLFVKCFAIKADEPNDNGDYFSAEELRKAYGTFIGVPVFTNHQNTDINQARGKVVHSWWDDDRNGIMVIMRVDSVAYPQLSRGIKEKYMVGTSMGCRVNASCCSVCHNYATVPDEYCNCVKNSKTRRFSGKKKCAYEKYGPLPECPICGCKKGEDKVNVFKEADSHKIFEYNFGVHFIENSLVVNPACHDCGVTEVIDAAKFLKKVADIQNRLPFLLKCARSEPLACTDKSCMTLYTDEQVNSMTEALNIVVAEAENIKKASDFSILDGAIRSLMKHAGQNELNKLNQALDLMSEVSKAMLEQKAQLDLEFLSDLIQVVADLQTTIDELTEQGYGRLQSPNGEQAPPVDPAAPPGAVGPAPTGAPPPATPAPTPDAAVKSSQPGIAKSVVGPLAFKTKRFDIEKTGKIKGNNSNTNNTLGIKLNMLRQRSISFKKK